MRLKKEEEEEEEEELITTTTGRCGVESTTSRTATSDWVLYISFYSVVSK
jgi:hypothetical protein